GGLMRRVVDALVDPKGEGAQDLQELLGKAVGGVDMSELAAAIGGPAQELHDLQQQYADLIDQKRKAKTPEEAKAIEEKMGRLRDTISAKASAIHKIFKETKFGEGVTLEEIEQSIPLEKLKELSDKAAASKESGAAEGAAPGAGDVS